MMKLLFFLGWKLSLTPKSDFNIFCQHKRINPSPSHAAPMWKSQRFFQENWIFPGLVPAGSRRTHRIPTPCSEKGSRIQIPQEFGMCWNSEEKAGGSKFWEFLGSRHKEKGGKREFHGILWVWDGFFPLPVWLLQRSQHWGSAGSSQVRNSTKIRNFMECQGLGGKRP